MSLVIEGLTRRFGGLVAVDEISFSVQCGEVTALIGPNGAGKTTLLNLVSGILKPDRGRVALGGKDVTGLTPHHVARFGLARTFQTPQLFGAMSVLETVMTGAHLRGITGFTRAILGLPSVRKEETMLEETARKVIAEVDVPEDLIHRVATDLPYGIQKKVEIARALATNAKVLLLDEPAAGLNANETDEIARLIRRMSTQGRAILMVEHDMDMVMELSSKVVVTNFGRKIAEGAPSEIQRNADVIEAYLGVEDAADA